MNTVVHMLQMLAHFYVFRDDSWGRCDILRKLILTQLHALFVTIPRVDVASYKIDFGSISGFVFL